MSNFEPNAILRGAQLTVVGTIRALQNPELFRYRHFRHAALAGFIGLVIHLLVQIPIFAVKKILWLASWVSDLDHATWDDKVTQWLNFVSHSVLGLPFLLMTLMLYITPALDEIFMESLKWVDSTYSQKHKSDNPKDLRAMYYPNLVMYPTTKTKTKVRIGPSKPLGQAVTDFAKRYARRVSMWFGIYIISLLPVAGRYVMPGTSFFTFRKAVGTAPAIVIFGLSLFLPREAIVMFLHTYFASRSLMRELLQPYFRRIQFNEEQKRQWFLDREGVLFGFAFGFTLFIKVPLVGFLIYGVAQASTAYLITKITDPPPAPADREAFAETQVKWTNKHNFLRLSLDNLDKYNIAPNESSEGRRITELQGKKFS
ncbi:hypothetical protein Egran_03395 [Elaphomyces granulatus]|uniref:Transmembrane protein UsgS n=1 Tax=Elaphomyces granulatus TaxID=519963 RepID=A0A232LXE8_9EURO|nr:hypothetical protein Egran_03395 [Elaphomyces granulatus]